MTDSNKLLLEASALQHKLGKLAYRLDESFQICRHIDLTEPSDAEFREFEALSARFERALDILVRPFFRLLDRVEDTTDGTILDVLNRAEKRGLIDDAVDFREMRLKRNAIAHEYLDDEALEMVVYVIEKAPTLLTALKKAQAYPLR